MSAPPQTSVPPKHLADLTLRDLLADLSSSAPIPGGGSAAALAGAMGASLVAMVAALTVGRAEYAEVEGQAREIGEQAGRLRDELVRLAQVDSEAYEAVVRARKLPRETDAQKASRSAALADAMHGAAETPLATARAALQTLDLAGRIAPIGNRNAASDAGVAAQLASAGVRGAILNVRINLPYLPAGSALRNDAPSELEWLETEARQRESATLSDVAARLG